MCNNEEVSGPGDSCLHSCPSGTVVKTVGFGARQLLGFRSWLCHFLPWIGCLMALSLLLHLLNENQISSISLIGLLWESHITSFEECLENRNCYQRSNLYCSSSSYSI